MIWIQLIILLTLILVGARMKGIGLGLTGMLGMLIFVFVFHMRPAEPPIDVLIIILAIVTTGACLQAAGGLDYLVGIAEKIIRSNPARITLVAPFVSFFLCLFAGTSHIVYSLLPIIVEVSAKKGVRPERPLSMTVVASHLALTGSPMSAATAVMAGLLAYPGAQLDIMQVCIPATIVGVLAGCLSVWNMGKPLQQDKEFLLRMEDVSFREWMQQGSTAIRKQVSTKARFSVWIFGAAILAIVLFGAFPEWLPKVPEGKAVFGVQPDGTLRMPLVIALVTLTASALMLLLTGTSATDVTRTSLFTAMATALVSVLGVVWMSATFISHHEPFLKTVLGDITAQYPWTFALALLLMGMLMFSQAATTRTMMPLGLSLGITHPHLIAMFPALNSDFIVPGYPTLLAAIHMDRTGSTHIGRYLFNHSFIRGGLIALAVTVSVGFLLSSWLLEG